MKELITLSIAVVGAVLGLINTWHNLSQRKLRLRVTPSYAIGFNQGPNPPTFAIEVLNTSSFAVTITEVGFLLGKARGRLPRRGMVHPYVIDGGPWPRRLESREAVTVYCYPDSLQLSPNSGIGKAYARTACDEITKGDSRALAQLRRDLNP